VRQETASEVGKKANFNEEKEKKRFKLEAEVHRLLSSQWIEKENKLVSSYQKKRLGIKEKWGGARKHVRCFDQPYS